MCSVGRYSAEVCFRFAVFKFDVRYFDMTPLLFWISLFIWLDIEIEITNLFHILSIIMKGIGNS